MKNNIVKTRTCVYNINYHVVWSTKYRKKVLTPELSLFLKDLLYEIADDKEFVIHAMQVGEADHVHVFVSAHPKYSISYIVKMFKGISGRKLLFTFPELRLSLYKGKLWNPSYYVETIGSTSEENIKRYINNQKGDI